MFQKLETLELLHLFDMLPVKGHNSLYRDENTNAILNCNLNEYQEYLSVKNKKITEKYELDLLKQEIEELKSNMKKILMAIDNKQINNS